MKINRREFVGGLAAAAVGASLPALAIPRRATKSVNVYFHGLWVFYAAPDRVNVYAPCSSTHAYLFGRDDTSLMDLDSSGIYKFSAAPQAPASPSPKFRSDLNLLNPLPPDESGLASMAFKVQFPVRPKTIQSVRAGSATYDNPPSHNYSLVQLLTFDFNASDLFFGNGLVGSAQWHSNSSQSSDSLHLYAEPPVREPAAHAFALENQMAKILNLPWTLKGGTAPAAYGTHTAWKDLAEIGGHKVNGKCTPIDPPGHSMAAKKKSHSSPIAWSTQYANCMGIILGG